MKRITVHGKFLGLAGALMLAPVAVAVLTGFGLFGEHGSDTGEAFDSIVPGMTRADDLASLGFDPHAATIADAEALQHLKGRAADACLAADRYCTGYVFGKVTLLIMDGRVIDKVMTHA